MENVLPRYRKPLHGNYEPESIVEYWTKAMDFYEQKEFRKAVIETLHYINPVLLKSVDTSKDIALIQMQGSAEIHLEVTQTELSVKVPFLKISNKTNKVALLRRVAEVNFSPLRLAQIRLRNNELWFEYQMPLTLSQPYKVYDLLYEIATKADEFDDDFIEKYQTEKYKPLHYAPLSENDYNEIWSQIQEIFDDQQQYTAYFEEKQWADYKWDITIISLLRLANMPYMHGKLRNDLYSMIDLMNNSDEDFWMRTNKGLNFIKKLVSQTKEQIMSNVYHADHLISLKWRSSAQILSERLAIYKERIEEYKNADRHFTLAYYMLWIFMKLIYDFNLEKSHKDVIENVLVKTAGLSPEKATPLLLTTYYELLENRVSESEPAKKGFFSKLFK